MSSSGLPVTGQETVREYPCSKCGQDFRMRIVYPFWICPSCGSKLIPADRDQDVPDEVLRLDPASGRPIPQPKRTAAAPQDIQPPAIRRPAQSHKP
jgi:DNA-directed RNA polymerase subunit RPC12/RpoP